jgi:Ni,Fe-hydrogenase maturation factor
MADDGVGIRVARMVQVKLPQRPDISFKELSVSDVVEEILGFDYMVIRDSHTGSETEPGRIRKFTADDFMDTIHPGAPHGMNFASALEFYKDPEPD